MEQHRGGADTSPASRDILSDDIPGHLLCARREDAAVLRADGVWHAELSHTRRQMTRLFSSDCEMGYEGVLVVLHWPF